MFRFVCRRRKNRRDAGIIPQHGESVCLPEIVSSLSFLFFFPSTKRYLLIKEIIRDEFSGTDSEILVIRETDADFISREEFLAGHSYRNFSLAILFANK